MTTLQEIAIAIESIGISTNDHIIKVLTGTLDPSELKTYNDYALIYKIRHDAIHYIVCVERKMPFGEKKICELLPEHKDYDNPEWHLIKNQTPDIFLKTGMRIQIIEITVSSLSTVESKKASKYALLLKVLNSLNYHATLEIISISTTQGVPDRSMLNEVHKLSHSSINLITNILEGVQLTLSRIHQTTEGRSWFYRFRDVSTDIFDFKINDEDIVKYFHTTIGKAFNDEKDLLTELNEYEPSNLTDYDNKIIEKLVDLAEDSLSPMEMDEMPSVESIRSHHIENANRFRPKSILPIPFMTKIESDSAIRHTSQTETPNLDDIRDISMFLSKFSEAKDPYWHKFSPISTWMFELKLSESDRLQDAIEGPGRKKYLNKSDCPLMIKQAEQEDRRSWLSIEYDYNEIERVANELSQINYRIAILNEEELINAKGPGLDYVRCFQSIMREIAINSHRKDRKKKFIIRPVGIQGYFVLIYPGPRLRTGENLSTIWYRILIDKKYKETNYMSKSWVFQELVDQGPFLHTRWLSIDANRLDHYIRAFDKIIMAYSCYMQFSANTIMDNIAYDSSNTLGMIILTYLEDRRCTSKMLQDVRYLVMGSLSMFRYWTDILDRFKDPIRSSLQAYYLQRILKFVLDYPKFSKECIKTMGFGKPKFDQKTNFLDDSKAGSFILLPRILTVGKKITFQQMLCEMYFTMLFNKNQDDPTHSSFQILTKILEGEDNLKWVKEVTGLHTGYNKGDFEDIEILAKTAKKNQFSRRVIMIASKLQSQSRYNSAQEGMAHFMSAQDKFLNKTLDEFATFKSSAITKQYHYSGKIIDARAILNDLTLSDEEKEHLLRKERESIKSNYTNQNERRRCIEAISELLENKIFKSFELLNIKNLIEPNYYHVFKKNQIGGVREIVILDIKKRILINILESFSRSICREDSREMLTHGERKYTLMRDMIRELKKTKQKNMIVNYNYDKAKWGPSFMPIQFLYMFKPFRHLINDLYKFIMISLMNHTDKRCVLPEKLIRAWISDPYDMNHRDEKLNQLKKNFMNTKQLWFLNESNMGQGILHYTSSYYHLCVLSLRDEIYYRLCKRKNLDPGNFRDIVSSDDSFTAHASPMDHPQKLKMRVRLMLRAQWIVERMMNVWTSKAKSSISILVYEFNSLFGSNLGVFPTTLKYALASVHPLNTDSFYRMVKESYNSSRQLVENGGSLELYLIAQNLNKIYSEQIYHTYSGGVNDPMRVGIRPRNMPYHLGVFPVGDPAIMLMLGPEFHNYAILSKVNEDSKRSMIEPLSPKELKLWINSHQMIDITPDTIAGLNNYDNLFSGLIRIEANIGPIKRLLQSRRKLKMNWNDVWEKLKNNPLLIIRHPENLEECKIKTFLKLYQNSAAEALRTTAPSIYYNRVAATVTANAFYIPHLNRKIIHTMEMREYIEKGVIRTEEVYYDENNVKIDMNEENKKNKTYLGCLYDIINLDVDQNLDIDKMYGYQKEYDVLSTMSILRRKYKNRSYLQTQNIRSLTLNKDVKQILNPIPNLLYRFWFKRYSDEIIEFDNSELRDWITLKEILPIIGETIDETLNKFRGSKENQIRQMIMVIQRAMTFHGKPMKAIVFGPSTKSYDVTFNCLHNYNYFYTKYSTDYPRRRMDQYDPDYYNDIFHLYNYFVLSSYYNHDNKCIADALDLNLINACLIDPGISQNTKKRLLVMAIYFNKLLETKIWTSSVNQVLHRWDVKQKYDEKQNKWYGDYSLRLQLGRSKIIFSSEKGINKILYDNISYPKELYQILKRGTEILDIDINQLHTIYGIGNFIVVEDYIRPIKTKDSFMMNRVPIEDINFTPGNLTFDENNIRLEDVHGRLIFSITKGLLQCESGFTLETYNLTDFEIDDQFYYSDVLELNAFSYTFNIDNYPPSKLNGCIRTTITSKPTIKPYTVKRLKIVGYEEKDYNIVEEIEESKVIIESKDETYQDQQHIPDELFGELTAEWSAEIVQSLQKTNMVVSNIPASDELDFNEVLMNANVDIDMNILLAQPKIKITKPIATWNMVINLKKTILASLVIDISDLNKAAIKFVNRTYQNDGILYSLIYVYDQVYTSDNIPSPREISRLKLSKHILKITGQSDEDDE